MYYESKPTGINRVSELPLEEILFLDIETASQYSSFYEILQDSHLSTL